MADEHAAVARALTTSEKVYNYLRELIIKNKIAPNQRVNEKAIAKQFESSTTPVREAILRLSAEGFIEVSPYRHMIVKEISPKEMEEMYEVMMILDYHALKLAFKALRDDDVQKIKHLTAELERYCSLDSLDKYLEINARIHTTLWESVQNQFLNVTLRQVYDRIQRYSYVRYSLFMKQGALNRSLRKHKKLLDAVVSRDASNLLNLVRDHWRL